MTIEAPHKLDGDELKQLEAHFGHALGCEGFLVHGGWLVVPVRPAATVARPKAEGTDGPK